MKRKKDDLCKKIEELLRNHFPNDTVDASLSGIRSNVHVLVVSSEFDGRSESQKQEYLWDLLERGGLSEDELNRISQLLPLSTGELAR